MRKVQTGCCALAHLDKLNNNTDIRDIQSAIRVLKKQKEENTEVGITTGNGQTAIFSIVSPGEDILENNLIECGFKEIHQFERRKGYPSLGNLKMYILNL